MKLSKSNTNNIHLPLSRFYCKRVLYTQKCYFPKIVIPKRSLVLKIRYHKDIPW